MPESQKVAVIGAGAAGLIATRELLHEGHNVVIFEKSGTIGGLWAYDPRVESDELGFDPAREIIHSSVYKSLRTNLPRVVMSFSGFELSKREYGDPRKFPGHEEVLGFLSDFASRCGIGELTRFDSEVVRVERVEGSWVVEWRARKDGRRVKLENEEFDAVVVCNGHCTIPKVAHLRGIEKWPGKQTHSHNYRVPEPFTDQVVIVIGNGPSACDISRDISDVAKEVHVSSRSPDAKYSKFDHYHNLWQHSAICELKEDGTVEFEDGSSVQATVILYCTGYKYDYPFLNTNGIVTVDDNRVGPLYKHVFPPELAPWLSFVGIPQKIIIFDMMELQSKWIARVLSGKVSLPTSDTMMADVREFYQQLSLLKRPKHLTHFLLDWEDYLDDVAAQAGVPPLEDHKKEANRETLKRKENNEDGYRDE